MFTYIGKNQLYYAFLNLSNLLAALFIKLTELMKA